jgi:pimeloyl-ACP methyl ester carboxylesterase
MLGDAGYEAYAPDWPGHGDSSKPSSSSFKYSQQAYLDSLAAFVDKCGIKKPFALVVQVGCALWWSAKTLCGSNGDVSVTMT